MEERQVSQILQSLSGKLCRCLQEPALYLCRLAEAYGSWFQAVKLIQVAIYGKIADEVVHFIVLLSYLGLLRYNGLGRVKAVVHPPDALAIADCQPCN